MNIFMVVARIFELEFAGESRVMATACAGTVITKQREGRFKGRERHASIKKRF